MGKINVLVTAAGGGGTNNMIYTVEDDSYNFVGTNADKFKAACSYTHPTFVVPRAVDEEKYISAILEIIEKEDIHALVPNSDIEVEILAKHIDKINAKTLLPDHSTVTICQDKMRMYDFCIRNDIPVAKTINIGSMDDLGQIDEVFGGNYPLWCRIKSGAGSKHTSKIYSVQDARNFISHVLEANNIEISEFLVSELLPGNDYAVMCTWRNGELVLCKMAHRMHYFGKQGESPPYVIKTFFDKDVYEFAKVTSRKFQEVPHGNFNFDLKLDANGGIALTEINSGRFYYNMPIFNLTRPHNAFKLYLKALMGEDISNTPLIDNEEKYFIRDMDNWPRVFSKEEMESKIRIIE